MLSEGSRQISGRLLMCPRLTELSDLSCTTIDEGRLAGVLAASVLPGRGQLKGFSSGLVAVERVCHGGHGAEYRHAFFERDSVRQLEVFVSKMGNCDSIRGLIPSRRCTSERRGTAGTSHEPRAPARHAILGRYYRLST